MTEERQASIKVNLDDKGSFLEETLDVEIEVNGKQEIVVIKQLTAGVQRNIRRQCTKTKLVGNQPQVDINSEELEILLLNATIVKAPFKHDLESIRKYPNNLFDYLFKKFQEFINPTSKKKE